MRDSFVDFRRQIVRVSFELAAHILALALAEWTWINYYGYGTEMSNSDRHGLTCEFVAFDPRTVPAVPETPMVQLESRGDMVRCHCYSFNCFFLFVLYSSKERRRTS